MVVGMVVAGGDVDEGVEGIGVAVPLGKILNAIAKAHETLESGQLAALTVHDTMSAEVVDELIQQGTLHSVRDAGDLKKSFADRNMEQEAEQLANRLNDADLVLFVAGNLWNASLAIRYGGVRKVGERTLNEAEAQSLSNDLRVAAIRLTKRAGELDTTISTRSSFVRIERALGCFGEPGILWRHRPFLLLSFRGGHLWDDDNGSWGDPRSLSHNDKHCPRSLVSEYRHTAHQFVHMDGTGWPRHQLRD